MTTQAPTTEQTRNAWDSIATGFDEFVTPENIEHGKHAIRGVHVGPGTSFLDVAAGSGALSIPAARLGAHVVATDISPMMVERLVVRAHAEGLSSLDARLMDGHVLEFGDDTFDVAASQHGVSLFPDVARGLAEMVRVTKPGGRLLVVAFGPLAKAEFLGFFMGAIKAAVPGFASLSADPPPLPFQLADPAVFRDKLVGAGLSDVSVETSTWHMPMQSAGHMWNMVTSSNPIGAQLVAGLTENQRAEVLRVLDGMLRERSGGEPGATLYSEVNIGVGRT